MMVIYLNLLMKNITLRQRDKLLQIQIQSMRRYLNIVCTQISFGNIGSQVLKIKRFWNKYRFTDKGDYTNDRQRLAIYIVPMVKQKGVDVMIKY